MSCTSRAPWHGGRKTLRALNRPWSRLAGCSRLRCTTRSIGTGKGTLLATTDNSKPPSRAAGQARAQGAARPFSWPATGACGTSWTVASPARRGGHGRSPGTVTRCEAPLHVAARGLPRSPIFNRSGSLPCTSPSFIAAPSHHRLATPFQSAKLRRTGSPRF